MSKAYLRFWGVRGSYPAPFESHLKVGGNTSCVEIREGNTLIVCDAGTGIIELGKTLIKQNEIRKMLVILTHYHWDHISGLPFFSPAFSSDWKLHFFGPGRTATDIKEHFSNQMKAPYFPVGTETWRANIEYLEATSSPIHYGPIAISFQNVHHPGVTYGYQLEVAGKKIVYISDNECLFLEKSIYQRYDEFNTEEKELFDKMIQEQHESELSLFRGADILIHDAQYTPADYEKKKGWGHSCYIDTVNMAIDAGVKHLFLFHHDPNYDDNTIESLHQNSLQIIQQRNSSLICDIAKEGLQVNLD